MPVRISSNQMAESSILGINSAYARLDKAQRKINTGKQVQTASDDPAGTAQILNLRSRLREVDQFNRIIDQAKGSLQTTDSALDNINNLLRQARTMAVQAATGSLDQQTRQGLATQVDNIISQVGSIGNTSYNGRYIFAGQLTNTIPMKDNGTAYSYEGGTTAAGNGDIFLDIGRNEPVKTNVTGDRAILPVIQILERLRDHMASGEVGLISRQDLKDLDTQITDTLAIRADIGSKVQRLTQTQDRNELTKINFNQFISDVEDADIPNAIVDFQMAQTAYQAALQSTANSFQNSLLDFLR